ncbi:UNVERIFIED_CONTAM: hypothetical protein OHV15_10720 [Microbacterium sp. SLM126]|uniref:hypothetical protein n=1 Tax=Microbacterium sp. Root180 TaxID=1736483 RepID=UPI0006F3AA69|nr:hypothetical protein [Microbacterium sp. Root180]KRB36724.1 hypothetical protein ASD93_11835 [Microbacterium sp. Root180]
MAELTRPVPDYRLLLPDGWEQLPADRAGVDELIRRTSAVFREQHRPELDAEMRTLLEVAYRKMLQAKAFALYLQTSAVETPLPMSIVASVVEGQLGGTLDRQVAQLFRDKGAEFLTDDRSILRWEADVAQRKEVEGASAHVIDYLIPVPGTERRRALQFTTTIPVPTGVDIDVRPVVEGLVHLSDLLISTFTWESRAA